MKQSEFTQRKWGHSEEIIYTHKTLDYEVSCMLLAVDFEEGLFKLTPFDTELYEKTPFWCRFENCKRPLVKLRIKK